MSKFFRNNNKEKARSVNIQPNISMFNSQPSNKNQRKNKNNYCNLCLSHKNNKIFTISVNTIKLQK